MGSERMRRVDRAIRQVLADELAGSLKDPRVGFVTVTDIRTTGDLRSARVYVSVLGDDDRREATLDGLRHAHGHLQARIAGQLGLKRTPTLEFVYDDTADKARRVDELIRAADMPPLVDAPAETELAERPAETELAERPAETELVDEGVR
jgi:ribosome-binding factor A